MPRNTENNTLKLKIDEESLIFDVHDGRSEDNLRMAFMPQTIFLFANLKKNIFVFTNYGVGESIKAAIMNLQLAGSPTYQHFLTHTPTTKKDYEKAIEFVEAYLTNQKEP